MHALYLWLTLRNLVHGCQLALADIWATSAPLSSLVWTYLALHATKQQPRAFYEFATKNFAFLNPNAKQKALSSKRPLYFRPNSSLSEL